MTVRVAPAEPQISTKGLQFTGFSPIQPLPSIKETVAQTQNVVQQTRHAVAEAAADPVVTPEQPVQAPDTQAPAVDVPVEAEPKEPVAAEEPVETAEPQNEGTEVKETFEECWFQMVDSIFQKKPAFYHQLRDYLPRYENDIIYVDVENDFQKNQLEMSKRAMLEYWREHFQLNVDEMEFVIHEHERKKVIYTSEDKVNNMLEQNPALKDFLQVLNFRIKD